LLAFVAGLAETEVDIFAVLTEPVAYLFEVVVALLGLALRAEGLLDGDYFLL